MVLLIAALALAVFGTTTQTWLTVHLDPQQLGQAGGAEGGLQVQGSKAATTVTALALVALAGGLAASIAGKDRPLGHRGHHRAGGGRHHRRSRHRPR